MSLQEIEINITAYQHQGTLNHIVSQIDKAMPDSFIRVWDNSLDALSIPDRVDEIRWNKFNPSLSRVWNWCLGVACSSIIMITNDDIDFTDEWYNKIENEVDSNPDSLWYGPSRCFLIRPEIVNSVGWFDERLTGLTYEDLDYVRRMNFKGIKHLYGTKSVLHYHAPTSNPKPSREPQICNNDVYMKLKYGEHNLEDFNKQPLFDTPDFYPARPR